MTSPTLGRFEGRSGLRDVTGARSSLVFSAGLAVLANALRLFAFDFWEYFRLQGLPNHDMYQGAATFATSMHALRVDGDIAWWLPTGANGGYAQYYIHFLSPLAPTAGNVVFVLWSIGIRALSAVSVAVPEYLQYLAITFLVYPFLAYLTLGLLCSQVLHHRLAVTLVVIAYALSGIGLWNSAWFTIRSRLRPSSSSTHW